MTQISLIFSLCIMALNLSGCDGGDFGGRGGIYNRCREAGAAADACYNKAHKSRGEL